MGQRTALASRSDPGERALEFAFSDSDFQTIARKVRDRTGIVLGAAKRSLVYGRLGRRLRVLGMRKLRGLSGGARRTGLDAEQG